MSRGKVSILVLVDVSLEAGLRERDRVTPGFQSLFSWMFRSKRTLQAGTTPPERFQSLFSWMFRSKLWHDHASMGDCSFNPCSRGCFARSLGSGGITFSMVLFQSLFSWMFRSKVTSLLLQLPIIAVSILVLVDVSLEDSHCTTSRREPGVSILVLVDVSLEVAAIPISVLPVSFQSLFSWMFRSKNIYS